MITLAISQGTATAMTVNDTGSSGYVLLTISPGQVVRENALASSRWLDGASLVSTRDDISQLEVTLRAYGTTLADTLARVEAFGSAIGQFSYTVTATYSGGSVVYNAMPASYTVTWDPSDFRANSAVISATIPRQP